MGFPVGGLLRILKPGFKEYVVDNPPINFYDLDIIHDTKGRGT
jgi:hypothetical protein